MEPVEIYYPGGGGRSAVSVQRVSGGLYSHFYEDEVRESSHSPAALAGTKCASQSNALPTPHLVTPYA